MKKLIKVITIFLLLISIVGFLFVKSMYPSYKGNLQLEGLEAKVSVTYDENGIPHIVADNQEDACLALGYVHAQDRLWQMELMRRITSGRLSEVFGPDMLKVDQFMGSLGVEENVNKRMLEVDKSSKSFKLAESYLKGVNQFIDNGATPIEFHLLDVKKEHYTIKDIYHVFGYVSFSFANAFKQDPLVNYIYDKYGEAYVKELSPLLDKVTIIKRNSKKQKTADISVAVNQLLGKLPVPLLEGSNSWVLGGEKTKNGKVIFANDPHIEYSQPSVWYQAHIKTPDYENYGFYMALMPFPLLGHNYDYAYGITMFENDDIDFYKETVNPKNSKEYLTEKGAVPFQVLEKQIKVKGQEPFNYKLRYTRHGVVMNDVLDHISTKTPISMQWVFNKAPLNALVFTHKMSRSKTQEEFKNLASTLTAPGLNLMYGSANGDIAMYGAAKLYKYKKPVNRSVFFDGSSGEFEIDKYIDFKDNLQVENPVQNYVYSANNYHDTIAGINYPGYYCADDRAKRIEKLLNQDKVYDVEDVRKMMLDVTSDVATEIVKEVLRVIDLNDLNAFQRNVLSELELWNGAFKKGFVAPTVYTRFIYEYVKGTYADEMGEKGFDTFLHLNLENLLRSSQISKNESVWWDDVTTKNVKETRKDVLTHAFVNSVSFLEKQLGNDISKWNWSKVFSVHYPHPLEKGGSLLKKIFSVGPFAVDGSKGVINNIGANLNGTGYYTAKIGPSTRRVIDFSNVEKAVSIIPTGQSGNLFSPFYKDQTQKYINGEYVNMYLNPKDYQSSNNVLLISPK